MQSTHALSIDILLAVIHFICADHAWASSTPAASDYDSVVEHISTADLFRYLGANRRGHILVHFASEASMQKMLFHKPELVRASTMLAKPPPSIVRQVGSDASVPFLHLNLTAARQQRKLLKALFGVRDNVNLTQLMLFETGRRYPHDEGKLFRVYEGPFAANRITEFVWMRLLPNFIHARRPRSIRDIKRNVPCFVFCSESSAIGDSYMEELTHVAEARRGQAAAVVVTNKTMCPFEVTPSVGFAGAGKDTKWSILKGPELSRFGMADWLLNSKVHVLPELSADNKNSFLMQGWFMVVLYDHQDVVLSTRITDIISPLVEDIEAMAAKITMVSARSARYNHQFGLKKTDHAVVFKNLSADSHPLEDTIVGFTESSELQHRVRERALLIAKSTQVEFNHRLAVTKTLFDEEQANELANIFVTKNISRDDLLSDLDTVDDRPTFETYIWSHGRCVASIGTADQSQGQLLCDKTERIIQERIMPELRQIVHRWKADGLLQVSKAAKNLSDWNASQDLVVCNSFVRRYFPMERRQLAYHKDDQSLVTVNVLLNSKADFSGGLAVFPEAESRLHLGQVAYPETDVGAAVVHRSDLYHGVDMKKGRRYSWIIWFREHPKLCGSRVNQLESF